MSSAGLSMEVTLPEHLAVHPGSGLVLADASLIKPRKLQWLWPRRLPLGTLVILGSDPESGKSTLAANVTATVTTGRPWPDGSTMDCPPGEVILLSAEDLVAEVTVPRLLAAGADLGRVRFMYGVMRRSTEDRLAGFSLVEDLSALDELLGDFPHCRLVCVDTWECFLGDLDTNKNTQVRSVLMPFAEIAEEHGVTILLLQHLNKNYDMSALHRIAGSVAIAGAARSVFSIARDPDHEDHRYLINTKTNLSKRAPTLAFSVEPTAVNGAEIGRIQWDPEPVEVDMERVLSPQGARRAAPRAPKLEEAKAFLSEALSGAEEVYGEDVKRMAEEREIAPKTLRTAREALGILNAARTVDGKQRTFWSLPCRDQGPAHESREGGK